MFPKHATHQAFMFQTLHKNLLCSIWKLFVVRLDALKHNVDGGQARKDCATSLILLKCTLYTKMLL